MQKLEYQYRMSQDELAYTYENAQARMNANPEFADKHKKAIQTISSFKNEKDALKAAIDIMNEKHSECQIWAKIEKVDDIYRIQDYWITIDDGLVKQSADYIGMALMYDTLRLRRIIRDKVKIDDVIAYW